MFFAPIFGVFVSLVPLVSTADLAQGFISAIAADADDFAQACLAFQPQNLVDNSTLTNLQYVPAGTNVSLPGTDKTCGRPYQVASVDVCRVSLTIPTSNRSSTVYEQWLPRNWTGRLLATGNGGIAGCIGYDDIAYGTQNGFATTGTNNGHNGTGGVAFLNNDDVVTDYSWRALHTSAVSSKALAAAFYNQTQTKAYYLGCSAGGRQGFKAAEMFPDDFDGLVAGCPGVNFNYLISWRASFFAITGAKNSSDFISRDTWTGLIHNEVLNQCDMIDGVQNGIIEDPSLCNFRPEALLCNGTTTTDGNATTCLTPTQVDVVRRVYSPLMTEQGQEVYPGLQPGGETMAVQRLLSGTPFSDSVDWFRYVVYKNASFQDVDFTVRDATAAEDLNPSDVRSFPSSLAPLQARGSKLLTYHGGADNQITGFDTERLYNHISTGMNATSDQLDDFMRFFRIPGMFHCGNGPGAWQIGQDDGVPFDPDRNVLAAMVRWVENGTAPDTVLGTKFVDDEPANGIAFQHRHCRFPLRSTYVGGNWTMPDSWACQMPDGAQAESERLFGN